MPPPENSRTADTGFQPGTGRRRTEGWPALLLAGLALAVVFLVEFLLFDRFGSHQVTPLYPRWNDQIQYLSECYTGFEFARAHGFLAGLWHTLVNPSAQGTLHDFAALILFKFTGPSRSAALALNMLALIAWQAALFVTTLRLSQSRLLAFASALLPVALRGPWQPVPGSAYDFRLDHFAMCALGVSSATAVLTRGFRSRGWSLLFGVAVSVTLLTRFLTGTYFIVIFLVFAVWVGIGPERVRRWTNLALAGGVAAILAGPIFWLNRESVWDYYYIGHYIGPESAIRNQNFGLQRSLQFVFGCLGDRHLGEFFGFLAVTVVIVLGIARVSAILRPATTRATGSDSGSDEIAQKQQDFPVSHGAEGAPRPTRSDAGLPAPDSRRSTDPLGRAASPLAASISSVAAPASFSDSNDAGSRRGGPGELLVPAVAFFIAPALILTLHPQKSPVVVSALVPGVILVVIGCWIALARNATRNRIGRCVAIAALVGGGLAALGYFAVRQTSQLEDPATVANLRQVNALADYVFAQSDARHLDRPRVAVDYITDAFDGQVLRVICYERHHVWTDFDMRLPTGITAPDPNLVRRRVAESDFVFLTVNHPPSEPYPYDRALAALDPELRSWCDTHLRPAKHFTFLGREMVMYEREK
ncbi:MAG TPA: hypothetical protein VHE61_15340 [Opitutaceae bacterium]|nr:hypothetical protein [Opitutaceae bacterium]